MDIVAMVITAVLAGGGAYLGSYLKKKGENLATHEDVNDLVKQVEAVTNATKKIEAAISNDVWDRQKRWELKKEALFETTKEIGNVYSNIWPTVSAYEVQGRADTDDAKLRAGKSSIEAYKNFSIVRSGFSRAMALAILVSGTAVRNQLSALDGVVLKILGAAMKGDPYAGSQEAKQEYRTALESVRLAIREELDL